MFDDMFSRFHTIPACDGQTDRRTSSHGIVRAYAKNGLANEPLLGLLTAVKAAFNDCVLDLEQVGSLDLTCAY